MIHAAQTDNIIGDGITAYFTDATMTETSDWWNIHGTAYVYTRELNGLLQLADGNTPGFSDWHFEWATELAIEEINNLEWSDTEWTTKPDSFQYIWDRYKFADHSSWGTEADEGPQRVLEQAAANARADDILEAITKQIQ